VIRWRRPAHTGLVFAVLPVRGPGRRPATSPGRRVPATCRPSTWRPPVARGGGGPAGRPLIVVVTTRSGWTSRRWARWSYALRRLQSGRGCWCFVSRHESGAGRTDPRGRGPAAATVTDARTRSTSGSPACPPRTCARCRTRPVAGRDGHRRPDQGVPGRNPRHVLDVLRRLASASRRWPGPGCHCPFGAHAVPQISGRAGRTEPAAAGGPCRAGRLPSTVTVAEVAGVPTRRCTCTAADRRFRAVCRRTGHPGGHRQPATRDAVYRSMEPQLRQELHAAAMRVTGSPRWNTVSRPAPAWTTNWPTSWNRHQRRRPASARWTERLHYCCGRRTYQRPSPTRTAAALGGAQLTASAAGTNWRVRPRIEACAPSPLRSLAWLAGAQPRPAGTGRTAARRNTHHGGQDASTAAGGASVAEPGMELRLARRGSPGTRDRGWILAERIWTAKPDTGRPTPHRTPKAD